jgi:hypothetical protein
MENQREIVGHIHEGKCMKLWAVIHNIALREPDFVRTLRNRPDLPHASQNPGKNYMFENRSFAEEDKFNKTSTNVGYNSSSQYLQRILYEDQIINKCSEIKYQVNEILNDIHNPGVNFTTYKGKRVKTISKYR